MKPFTSLRGDRNREDLFASTGLRTHFNVRSIVSNSWSRRVSPARRNVELETSQSALSAALPLFHGPLGDELFVRTGRGLMSTLRTSALARALRETPDCEFIRKQNPRNPSTG